MIFEDQNKDEYLSLLAAQRQLYTEAKRYKLLQFLLAVFTAVVATVLVVYLPDVKWFVGLLGIGIAFLNKFVLEKVAKRKVRLAASIQETFDTRLFGIGWNESLAGSKVSPEDIRSAERRFSGDRKRLENWYPSTGNVSEEMAALICQRSNLVWDWRQRRYYSRLIVGFTLLVLVVPIGLGIWQEVTLLTYMLEYLAPTLPLLILGIDGYLSHQKVWKEQKLKEREINTAIEAYRNKGEMITKDYLRSVQDAIFKNRTDEHAMAPDFIYKLLQDRYEVNMTEAAKDLTEK